MRYIQERKKIGEKNTNAFIVNRHRNSTTGQKYTLSIHIKQLRESMLLYSLYILGLALRES